MKPITRPFEEGRTTYSNIDHEFEMTEEEVKNSCKYHQHAAYNFCGYVWWDNEREVFIEQVWQYKTMVDEMVCSSLELLIEKINEYYGDE